MQRRGNGAKPVWRPAFVGPRGPRIDDGVLTTADTLPGLRHCGCARDDDWKACGPIRHAERLEKREILVDDVPRRPWIRRFGVQKARQRLAKVPPRKPDRPTRTDEARQQR